MLSDGDYKTQIFNCVRVKNSQHSILIFHNENNASQKNDLRKIFQNCSQHLFKSSIDLVTDLYMEDIANIICHVY